MMADERPKRDIRVLRRKNIADVASAVVKDKAEMSEVEASLHRMQNRYNSAEDKKREVFEELLDSQLFLARTIRRMAEEHRSLKAEMAELRSLITRGGEVAISTGS